MTEFLDLIALVGWGFCLGVLFRLYRHLFARLEGRRFCYSLCYILWWIGLVILTILFLLWVNGGRLRLYGLFGMALGVAIFYQWFLPRWGPSLTKNFQRILRVFAFFFAGIRRVFSILLFPLGFVLGLLEKGILFLLFPLRKLAEKLKKNLLQDGEE